MAAVWILKISKLLRNVAGVAAVAVWSLSWLAKSKLVDSPRTPNAATGEIRAVEFSGVVKFTDPATARIWELAGPGFLGSIVLLVILASIAQHYERKLDPYWRFTEAKRLTDGQQFVYERRKWMSWLPPWTRR